MSESYPMRNISSDGFNTLPIESYPRANELGRTLCNALLDVCVMKGYVSVNEEGTRLKNEDDVLAPGVAEALCCLAEAFNF